MIPCASPAFACPPGGGCRVAGRGVVHPPTGQCLVRFAADRLGQAHQILQDSFQLRTAGLTAQQQRADAGETPEQVVLGEGGVAARVDPGVRLGQTLPGVRGHDTVERVQRACVAIRTVGGQVQDEGHRGGAEEEVGVLSLDERSDSREGAVHLVPGCGAAACPLDVQQRGAERAVGEGLARGGVGGRRSSGHA